MNNKKTLMRLTFLFAMLIILSAFALTPISNDILKKDQSKEDFLDENDNNLRSSGPFYHDFNFFKNITIDSSKVSGSQDLYNFPLMLSLYDSDLQDDAQSNGNDITFYSNSERLDYEIELYEQNYNLTHAHLVAWVRIPTLSYTTDTVIQMYYGNSTMSSQENPAGVWDNDYMGVWHLDEEPSGSSYDVYDSTSYGNDGIANSTATSGSQVTSPTGYGLELDGSYHITVDHSSSLDITGSQFTLEAWINVTRPAPYDAPVMVKTNATNWERYMLGVDGEQDPTHLNHRVTTNAGGGTEFRYDTGNIYKNRWTHICAVYDGLLSSNPRFFAYINGTLISSNNAYGIILSTTEDLFIGLRPFEGRYRLLYAGIDELRVSDSARSSDWIATEYTNQYDPESFYSVSSPTKIYVPTTNDFNFYKNITIDHNMVSGSADLTDFPVLLYIEDPDLHDKALQNGNDIAFFDGTTMLDFEIESFNQNYNSTHAQLIAWVRLPTLSASTDTTISMYYGNSTMPSQAYSSGVWMADYEAVWHLGEEAQDEATSAVHYDSSNIYDGDQDGNEDIAALIGNGQDFDGTDDTINVTEYKALNPDGNVTITGWFRLPTAYSSSSSTTQVLMEKHLTGDDDMHIALVGTDFTYSQVITGSLVFKVENNLLTSGLIYKWTEQNSWSADTWYYFACVLNSTDIANTKIYINGLDDTNSSETRTGTEAYLNFPAHWGIGGGFVDTYQNPAGEGWFDGTLDEVRVSTSLRSQEWLQTEYNNQLNPSNYLTLGNHNEVNPAPPTMLINSPLPYDLFGKTPPSFNIEASDISGIDSYWYRLTNGTVTTSNTTFTSNGSISNSAWDQVGNGTVTIEFYANDTMGNTGSTSVIVRKDIIAPIISITQPNDYDLFGNTPPTVTVGFNDPNIDETWYQLDDGSSMTNNYTWTGSISQAVWDQVGNGTVSIIFHANDTVSNQATESVIVRKDVIAPVITITQPSDYDLFGVTPPSVIVGFSDGNLDSTWYQLDDGTTTTNNYAWTGSIAQSVWDQVGNGTVTIIFYANDTMGNENSNSVIVRKDIIAPIITITQPSDYELFGTTPPVVNVSFTDPNLDQTWYQLDDGTVTTNNYTWTGTIAQSVWDLVGNGTVTIIFYANDTVGNFNSNSVIVRKDIIAPVVNITQPSDYDLFGGTPPSVTVAFDDANLDSTWYQLENGTLTTNNYTWTGLISQTVWDQMGNGTVIIRIYANDTMGNLGFSEVIVYKDIIAPIITINLPNDMDYIGDLSPEYDLSIIENNLDTMWYRLNNGSIITANISFLLLHDFVSQSLWDQYGNGTITLEFFANDTLGQIGYMGVNVQKDISLPVIRVTSPIHNQVFSTNAPDFTVITSTSGPELNITWYTIVGWSVNYTFSGTSGTINQTAWDTQGQGQVILRFFVNNTFGRVGFDDVIVIRDTINPTVVINYPTDYSIYGQGAPNYNVFINDTNLAIMWYSLDGGITRVFFTGNGTIDQTSWDNAEVNGTITIRFYANDTAGNLAFSQVIVRKDTIAPIIMIYNPIQNQYFGVNAPGFNVFIADINGISYMWYRVAGGPVYPFSDNGTVDQTEWEKFLSGALQITFYANDSLGNIASMSVSVRKDVRIPSVTVNLPVNNSYVSTAPIINVFASDAGSGINTIWYRVFATNYTSSIIILTNNVDQQLDGTIWIALLEGDFTIWFYANDSMGNLNDLYSVLLSKDVTPPSIPVMLITPSGDIEGTVIFEWQPGSDNTGIAYYNLTIYTVTPLGSLNTAQVPLSIITTQTRVELDNLTYGDYTFALTQVDLAGNISPERTGSFSVVAPYVPPPPEFPWWIIALIAGIAGGAAVVAIVVIQKKKKGKKTILKQLDKLEEVQKTKIEEDIEKYKKEMAEKKAADEEDKEEDFEKEEGGLSEFGVTPSEPEIPLPSEEPLQPLEEPPQPPEKIPTPIEKPSPPKPIRADTGVVESLSSCLNDLMTMHGDYMGFKYFSYPEIFPEHDKIPHGLILNDTKFLQQRVNDPIKGEYLQSELKLNEKKLGDVKAIQFVYTYNVSSDTLAILVEKYHATNLMLFVVYYETSKITSGEVYSIPKRAKLKSKDFVRIISPKLYWDLVGFTETQAEVFNYIKNAAANNDGKALTAFHNANLVPPHDTKELQQVLLEKGLIKNDINEYFKFS